MPTEPTRLARFARQEDGAIAVIVALCLTVLMGFVALGVDVASLYREKASLQSDGDLAAITAVGDLESATLRAQGALTQNGRTADTLAALETGRFLRNPALPPEQRFVAVPQGGSGVNAVRLRLADDAPLHFAVIFSEENHVTLDGNALAIRTGAASFSLSSHLLRLDAATLNDALSNSFGAEVALSAGDFNVLSGTEVDMGRLLRALDTQTGIGSRNPAAILDATTSIQDVVTALRATLPGSTGGALAAVETAAPDRAIPVAALAGGIDTQLGLTVTEFLADLHVSALDILRALVAQDTVEHAIDTSSSLGVPGVLSTDATLTAAAPPAQSGWVALGEEGVQLHRAAARVQTNVDLAPDLLGVLGAGVSITRLNLPLVTEIAGATARLTEIDCTADHPQDLAARFRTAHQPLDPLNGTSVAALYLGDLNGADIGNEPIDPATLEFADILDLSVSISVPLLPDINIAGITLQARSHVALGASQQESLRFTKADVRAGRTTQTFGSGDLLSSGISGLLDPANTEIRVKPGQDGLLSGLVGGVVQGVLTALPQQLLLTLAGPVDAVLDGTLNAAGIRLGEGELTVTGHHCEVPRLVR